MLQKGSIDLTSIRVDPSQPTIWFPPAYSTPRGASESTQPSSSTAGSQDKQTQEVAGEKEAGSAGEASALSTTQEEASGHAVVAALAAAGAQPLPPTAEMAAQATAFAAAAAAPTHEDSLPAAAEAAAPASGILPANHNAGNEAEGEFLDAMQSLPPTSSGVTAFTDARSLGGGWGSGALTPVASGAAPSRSVVPASQPSALQQSPTRETESSSSLAGRERGGAMAELQATRSAACSEGGSSGKVGQGSAAGGPRDESAAGEAGSCRAVQTAINIEASAAVVLGSGPAITSGGDAAKDLEGCGTKGEGPELVEQLPGEVELAGAAGRGQNGGPPAAAVGGGSGRGGNGSGSDGGSSSGGSDGGAAERAAGSRLSLERQITLQVTSLTSCHTSCRCSR